MDYKKDVLGRQIGAAIWMCYENDVLGRQVGATKKIGYKKDVLGTIGGKGHYEPHVAPVRGFSLLFDNVPTRQQSPRHRPTWAAVRNLQKKKKPSPPA